MNKEQKIKVLDAIRAYYGLTKNRDFAEFLGVSSAVLTNWYTRGTFDFDVIVDKCRDLDLNALLKKARTDNDAHQPAETHASAELLKLISNKDDQIIELSMKIGQLREQLKQLKGK